MIRDAIDQRDLATRQLRVAESALREIEQLADRALIHGHNCSESKGLRMIDFVVSLALIRYQARAVLDE